MPLTFNLYVDDSGTRHPDHKPRLPAHGHDWFGLGGVLVRSEDELAIRASHAALCARWHISSPLHSAPIRSRSGSFAWLGTDATKRSEFINELGAFCCDSRLIGIACVIDRPGYNQRYRETYGKDRWPLCRTAFTVLLERAAKFARLNGRKLRVYVERSDKPTEKNMHDYFRQLRSVGLPFSTSSSAKYAPLGAEQFSETLYEFAIKSKTSPLMQLADLYLWPLCVGGYDANNKPYAALRSAGRLIDDNVDAGLRATLGIKYSCFDLVAD